MATRLTHKKAPWSQLLRVPITCMVEDRKLTFMFQGRALLRHVFPEKMPQDIEYIRGLTITALKTAFPKQMALDVIAWAKTTTLEDGSMPVPIIHDTCTYSPKPLPRHSCSTKFHIFSHKWKHVPHMVCNLL